MLKQVVTFNIHPSAKEEDLLEFVSKEIWPKFDPAKCSLEAWVTDPMTSPDGRKYQFEATYFDKPEYEELARNWLAAWQSEKIKSYVGNFYSFETYWYMRNSSVFSIPGFSGIRTACEMNNCPRNVNKASAPSCNANSTHVFCNHRLVYCPKCRRGSYNLVK